MNQARLYNKMVPKPKKLKEELLTTILENVVWPINDLYKVKTNMDDEVAKGSAELTYKQYMTLLLSTAATFDAEKALMGRRALRENSHMDIYLIEGYCTVTIMNTILTPIPIMIPSWKARNGILNMDPTTSSILT